MIFLMYIHACTEYYNKFEIIVPLVIQIIKICSKDISNKNTFHRLTVLTVHSCGHTCSTGTCSRNISLEISVNLVEYRTIKTFDLKFVITVHTTLPTPHGVHTLSSLNSFPSIHPLQLSHRCTTCQFLIQSRQHENCQDASV